MKITNLVLDFDAAELEVLQKAHKNISSEIRDTRALLETSQDLSINGYCDEIRQYNVKQKCIYENTLETLLQQREIIKKLKKGICNPEDMLLASEATEKVENGFSCVDSPVSSTFRKIFFAAKDGGLNRIFW